MQVEYASIDDTPALLERWLRLVAAQRSHGSHLETEANRSYVRDRLGRFATSDRVIVARDEAIVGFVTFSLERGDFATSRQRGRVETIFVDADRRGEGIGSRLLTAAEDALRERGADSVALETLADNDAAQRFYRRHGYEPQAIEFEKRS